MNWFSGAVQYTVALSVLGDAERASEAFELLAPYAGRNCLTARAAATWGPVDSFLGRLAATAGRFEDAERHFRAGIESAERMGARTIAARTKWWYAEMLRARGAPGDAERADDVEQEADAEAERLGLTPWPSPSALSG